VIKCCDHQRDFSLLLEDTGKCARWWLEFGCELLVIRGAASASLRGLWCVRDLRGPRVCRCAAPRRDPVGSYIVETLRVSKAGM